MTEKCVHRFTPSGAAGSWSSFENHPTDNNGKDISRVTSGLYASGNDLGFALGGIEDYGTTEGYDHYFSVPGMVSCAAEQAR
jgi:hypothetical protein